MSTSIHACVLCQCLSYHGTVFPGACECACHSGESRAASHRARAALGLALATVARIAAAITRGSRIESREPPTEEWALTPWREAHAELDALREEFRLEMDKRMPDIVRGEYIEQWMPRRRALDDRIEDIRQRGTP